MTTSIEMGETAEEVLRAIVWTNGLLEYLKEFPEKVSEYSVEWNPTYPERLFSNPVSYLNPCTINVKIKIDNGGLHE